MTVETLERKTPIDARGEDEILTPDDLEALRELLAAEAQTDGAKSSKRPKFGYYVR